MLVSVLLCDAAQVAGGKLFILGGGWNVLVKSRSGPANMALAILVTVPWTETNQRHSLRATLSDEDGQAVTDPGGQAVEVKGDLEVGRPPGVQPGTSFNVPLAANIGVDISPGSYRWDVEIDGTTLASLSFTVTAAP